MPEHIPSADAECFAYCDCIAGIVFDASGSRSRRRLRFAAPALIEEHELSRMRERSESGPENVVTEMKTPVDAEQRHLFLDRRTRVDGEFESACVHYLLSQRRSLSLFLSKCKEACAG